LIWLCISTSSPLAGVALFDGRAVLRYASRQAPMRASGAVFALLDDVLGSAGVSAGEVDLFAADVGPGSFIGVRVGVTIAKTLAYANGKRAAGFSAFDLINPHAVCAVPSRKGSYLVRTPGQAPIELPETDLVPETLGYGAVFAQSTFPEPGNAAALNLVPIDPFTLAPEHILEPNISSPKTPYRVPE
jgi:tRNA threonylcarbamoyladenosine biosynthesis protein TsaB